MKEVLGLLLLLVQQLCALVHQNFEIVGIDHHHFHQLVHNKRLPEHLQNDVVG